MGESGEKSSPIPCARWGPSAQAEGDVRAASDGNLLELFQRKTALGQMTKSSQHSGSVSAAAAQTRHHRDALDQMNDDRTGQGRKSAMLKKGAGAAHRNVAVVARQRQRLAVGPGAGHLNIRAAVQRYRQCVAQVHRLHHHIHLMVAVGKPSDDVQRKIDFAGGMDGD